jgi:dihydropteroate synthase
MIEIMGIVNVTPDSFSDGGRYLQADTAIAHGKQLIADGATILDIGGESTRPGSAPVAPATEIARVVPVIEALAELGVPLSIDTRNAETMAAALAAGARIVNDVSALTHDSRSIDIVANSDCRIVLMHMQGTPQTMQDNPTYGDVVEDVYAWLESRVSVVRESGIAAHRIIVDPGIGFGKTVDHNIALLRNLAKFRALGTVMVGLSRKQFIARLSQGEAADRRLGGSIAAALFAAQNGADILRVHDAAETAQAVRVWQALN